VGNGHRRCGLDVDVPEVDVRVSRLIRVGLLAFLRRVIEPRKGAGPLRRRGCTEIPRCR
jgi:hypothetical protein